jgi:hypothetical protein
MQLYTNQTRILIVDKPLYFCLAVALGPKLSETVKGKLSVGAKVLQAGSMDKVFRQYFPVENFPVLSFNHSWPNSWNALHLNSENCLP